MSVTAPPSRPPTSSILYDWPRFWIPQTGILDLSDAGFLRDPVDSLYGPGPLRTLAQLETYPALALLGEPGIGKSATLMQEHERACGNSIREKSTGSSSMNSLSPIKEVIFRSGNVSRRRSSSSVRDPPDCAIAIKRNQ